MTHSGTEFAAPAAPIGYVLKVFPRLSETFVINEFRVLEALDTPLELFSLHRPADVVPHAVLRELRHPVRYVDDLPAPDDDAVRRASRQLERRLGIDPAARGALLPRKYVRLALVLADLARAAGVWHLHAHFASRAGHVAALAAALTGGSYSVTAHAKDLYHCEVEPSVLRWKLAGARFVVTVTDHNLRFIRALLGADPSAARVVRLYNGVDLSRFAAAPYPHASPPLVLAVGRLVEKKGFDVLVDACAILRAGGTEFRCEIIGGGPEEAALRQRIDSRGVGAHVVLRGTLPTETVADRLRNAAVLTAPCVRGRDGNVDALPTVLLEAMAAARPVVSTRLSGIPEIVADGTTGTLVAPTDPAALAAALAALLADPGRAAAMGRAGRARAEQLFDLQRNAAVLRRLLMDGVANGGEPCPAA
jgi:glycosyltransferase involved in cell wall biosynthesis